MSFVGGLLLGVLLGSLLGLLLAPSSGAETRRQLAERSETNQTHAADDGLLGVPISVAGAIADRVAEARRGAGVATAEEKARLVAEWARRKRGT
jgi:gas vesicle protein